MLTADAVVRGCTVDLLGLPLHLEAGGSRAAEAVVSVLGGARATSAVPRVQPDRNGRRA